MIIELDHAQYICSRPYRRGMHARIRKLVKPGQVHHLVVLHDADDACCRLQPWRETHLRLVGALTADGAPSIAALLLARRNPGSSIT